MTLRPLFKRLEEVKKQRLLSKDLASNLFQFFLSYQQAAEMNGWTLEEIASLLEMYLEEVVKESQAPFSFQPFHQRLVEPIDYRRLGLELMRPLVQWEKSKILGVKNIKEIAERIEKKENVILLSNHQTEPDPQLIGLLLEKKFPKLSQEMIFVAGQRVIGDPLAIPLSKGTNLLCIYSKKYIEDPPEEKESKRLHNQKTIRGMKALLEEGGKCIYVAPSGGRDRPGKEGRVEVASFDCNSVDLFFLLARQVNVPTHFYPLALSTYAILPPPDQVKKTLGEKRKTRASPIGCWFGEEWKEACLNKNSSSNKKALREERAKVIFETVKKGYKKLKKSFI